MKQHVFPDMQFWIKTPCQNFQLPIPPEDFEIEQGSLDKTIKLLNFGELNIQGEQALKTFSYSSFFPYQNYSWCKCNALFKPYEYINLLLKCKQNKDVLRCVVTGTNLNMQCTIADLSWGERDGSRDVYFNISFKEFKALKGFEVRI